MGEEIASFLGITTPKYSYEIKQYKRNQKERQKQAQEEKDVGGWMQQTQESLVNGSTSTVKNQQPSNVNAEQSERYWALYRRNVWFTAESIEYSKEIFFLLFIVIKMKEKHLIFFVKFKKCAQVPYHSCWVSNLFFYTYYE